MRDKGAMFLDWGGKPENGRMGPDNHYSEIQLSDLLNDPDSILTKILLPASCSVYRHIPGEEHPALKDALH